MPWSAEDTESKPVCKMEFAGEILEDLEDDSPVPRSPPKSSKARTKPGFAREPEPSRFQRKVTPPPQMDNRHSFRPEILFQAWRLVIRPPRSLYSTENLGPENLRVVLPCKSPGEKCLSDPHWRQDLRLRNRRGCILECSHFQPSEIRKNDKLPCVIFCHGSSSCRVDAFKIMPYLLQHNVTLFCLDFSGSGLSDGDYVTLGYHEQDDLCTVIDYLSHVRTVSSIGLWGKSMGAVAALMRTARDRRVDACVLDSPFANFRDLVLAYVKESLSMTWIPCSMVDFALSVVAEQVEARAGFNPLTLSPLEDAPKCLCPVIFGAAQGDRLIPAQQIQDLSQAWGGDSRFFSFEGDHNSDRPMEFLESAGRFLAQTLTCAADTDEKMSRAINTYFQDDAGRLGRDAHARVRGAEEQLIGHAVSDYVDRNHNMDAALDLFVRHGSRAIDAKKAFRRSCSVPELSKSSKPKSMNDEMIEECFLI